MLFMLRNEILALYLNEVWFQFWQVGMDTSAWMAISRSFAAKKTCTETAFGWAQLHFVMGIVMMQDLATWRCPPQNVVTHTFVSLVSRNSAARGNENQLTDLIFHSMPHLTSACCDPKPRLFPISRSYDRQQNSCHFQRGNFHVFLHEWCTDSLTTCRTKICVIYFDFCPLLSPRVSAESLKRCNTDSVVGKYHFWQAWSLL